MLRLGRLIVVALAIWLGPAMAEENPACNAPEKMDDAGRSPDRKIKASIPR